MDKYYIDLSVQNSSELLKNNYSVNLVKKNNYNNSNFNNNGDLIEGFGNFGRVNLEKCCPLEYMWSEGQKKCVKVCDGCAIGAYGDINYEFLNSNGEFMSFAQCVGDATGAYDFDKINRRYGADELLTQHDLNHHIDSDENASGVQPSEENPWADVISDAKIYGSALRQQVNIRQTGRWAGDDNTWNTYLDCNASGECTTASGSFTAITDVQRYDLQDGTRTFQEIEDERELSENPLFQNRNTICSNFTNFVITNDSINYNVCEEGAIKMDGWNNLCNIYDDVQFNELTYKNGEDNIEINELCIFNNGLCNEGNNRFIKDMICENTENTESSDNR